MLVGRHVFPPLYMSPHGQDVQRGDISGQGAHMGDAGLLRGLPQSHGQQIAVPVCVAAGPGPNLIDVVVGHEHLGGVGVDHKAGAGDVGVLILPGEHGVGVPGHIVQDNPLVGLLLLILRAVGPDVIRVHHVTPFSGRWRSGRPILRPPAPALLPPAPTRAGCPGWGTRHQPQRRHGSW